MNNAMILYICLLYILAGCCTGFLAGLFGVGGGIIVVPALLAIFQQTQVIPSTQTMPFAIGTSLALMLWTSVASIHAHTKQGTILWSIFFSLIKGISLGVILGGMIAIYIPTQTLKFIFGLFLILIAWKTIQRGSSVHSARFPKPFIHHLISLLIGFTSGLLGVGGGALIIPYLSWCGVDIRKLAGISAACTLVVSLTGSILFALTRSGVNTPIPMTIGYIYWPAVILMAIPSMATASLGVKLHHQLPARQLREAFALLLILMGGYLIVK